MAALTAGVAAGEVTPGEAAEVSKLVEACTGALEGERIRSAAAGNREKQRCEETWSAGLAGWR